MRRSYFRADDIEFDLLMDRVDGLWRGVVACLIPGCGWTSKTLAHVADDDVHRDAQVLARAHRDRHFPVPKRAFASSFADWVYRRINPDRMASTFDASPRSMADPTIGARFQQFCLQSYERDPRWELLYCGWRPESTDLPASRLRFGKSPMQGKPDFVCRSRADGEVRVVECKARMCEVEAIPTGGYPDNQAQLWCYCWSDLWNDSRVSGVIEYGHPDGAGFRLATSCLYLREDPGWNAKMAELFAQFGGEVRAR